ncbi:hypothetical protein [Rhizohabitans arisaemae]|uniref:hypothetical protein n=1 Tax=Rhizohabitans arisaemae TaxID=2720610 RepID=UPI0024B08913|nr:hypothetical protein [Rhizohabitans arisaemae]
MLGHPVNLFAADRAEPFTAEPVKEVRPPPAVVAFGPIPDRVAGEARLSRDRPAETSTG